MFLVRRFGLVPNVQSRACKWAGLVAQSGILPLPDLEFGEFEPQRTQRFTEIFTFGFLCATLCPLW